MGNCCNIIFPPDIDSPNASTDGFVLPKNEKVKFLLLGAGESGKSTLFKQMRINYVKDYKEGELVEEKKRIRSAFLRSFKDLIDAIRKRYNDVISDDPDIDKEAKRLFPPTSNLSFNLEGDVIDIVKSIWNSDKGQTVWEHHSEYPITDSLGYFCEHIDRIAKADYIPTEMDFLRTRIVSLGINEQTFQHKSVMISVVDVGGQRSERSKWLLCFDGVTAVIFVASISEFDQKLFEDARVNRIDESLQLFKKSTNFLVFRETPFVLFLNKQDLLEDKLKKLKAQNANLDDYFPSLGLGTNYDNALPEIRQYYKQKFLSVVTHDKGRIITHFVTATDKDTFKKVFQSAAQVVLRQTLKEHFLF